MRPEVEIVQHSRPQHWFVRYLLWTFYGPLNPQIECKMCRTPGAVRARRRTRWKTRARCGRCGQRWSY